MKLDVVGRLRPQRSRAVVAQNGCGWLAGGTGVIAALAGVDLSLPRNANISGALVVAPFFASVGARPRDVAGLGSISLLTAIALAFADGSGIHASVARVVVIVVGTVAATQAARLRIRREQRLVQVTNVAAAAQRAIIHRPPARVGGVAIASWYQSSAQAATVGGDCYEALDTPFGTRLLVGDVRGHGLPGVRLAALVVGGFRALAYLEPDLTVVAQELDLLTSRFSADPDNDDNRAEEFVTAVLAEINERKIGLANCGHPPPLLITSDGQVRSIAAPTPTRPLGLGSRPVLHTVTAPPAARLLLYTDGLIEARDPNRHFFDLAAAATELATGPLETGVAGIMERLNAHAQGQLVDDIALLVCAPCHHP